MSSFVDKATNNERVKELHRLIKKGKYHVDTVAYDAEVDKLHAKRLVRSLKTTELVNSFQRKFTDAALQNQAYRSRIIAIKKRCYNVSADLEEHLDTLRGYLRTKYPVSLSEYKTVADKNAAINSVLEKPIKLLSDLSRMDVGLEMIVKDIDQASWSLKAISEAFAMNSIDKSSKF